MLRSLLVGAFGAIALAGCSQQADDSGSVLDDASDSTVTSATALPATCRPTEAAALDDLYELTAASVRELITCGGIQMQVAFSMRLMVLASSAGLVSDAARSELRAFVGDLGLTIDNPFEHKDDGSWNLEGLGSSGSTLCLTFYDPTSSERIAVDPFALDSYLMGVTASSSLSWEQMQADPTAPSTFTYRWTGEGPLAHLLSRDGEIPNPIVLEMSLLDLAGGAVGLADVDYGPFAGAEEVLVESRIHVVDERGGANIAYDVTGRRSSVRELSSAGTLPLDVNSLVSATADFTLAGETRSLAYVDRGSLAGEIHYAVSGADSDVRVISDFGSGLSSPTPHWECQ